MYLSKIMHCVHEFFAEDLEAVSSQLISVRLYLEPTAFVGVPTLSYRSGESLLKLGHDAFLSAGAPYLSLLRGPRCSP